MVPITGRMDKGGITERKKLFVATGAARVQSFANKGRDLPSRRYQRVDRLTQALFECSVRIVFFSERIRGLNTTLGLRL